MNRAVVADTNERGPSGRARALRPALVLLLAVVAGAACSREPKDPVLALLAAVEEAAEARDADAVAEHLAPEFSGMHGLTRADALQQMKRSFAGYESIAVDYGDVQTTQEADAARVRCVVEFSGRARKVLGLEGLLPPEAVYRFELELGRNGEAWLVRSARWEPVGEEPKAAQP